MSESKKKTVKQSASRTLLRLFVTTDGAEELASATPQRPNRPGLVLAGIAAAVILAVIATAFSTQLRENISEVKNAQGVVANVGRILPELADKSGGGWVVMPQKKGELLVLAEVEAEKRYQECRAKQASMDRMMGGRFAGAAELFDGPCPKYWERETVIETYKNAQEVLAEEARAQATRLSLVGLAAALALALILLARPIGPTRAEVDPRVVVRSAVRLAIVGFGGAFVVLLSALFAVTNNKPAPATVTALLGVTTLLLVGVGIRRLMLASNFRGQDPELSALAKARKAVELSSVLKRAAASDLAQKKTLLSAVDSDPKQEALAAKTKAEIAELEQRVAVAAPDHEKAVKDLLEKIAALRQATSGQSTGTGSVSQSAFEKVAEYRGVLADYLGRLPQ